MRRLLSTLLCAFVLLAPRALAAQDRAAPLEGFVGSVARLWTAGDAAGISALAPEDGRIVLDLGTGQALAVDAHHAAAALRDLFRGRVTLSVRAAQMTLAGGEPPRGFGELAWLSRPRGVTDAESTTVYVGAVWESGAWRIRELRVLH